MVSGKEKIFNSRVVTWLSEVLERANEEVRLRVWHMGEMWMAMRWYGIHGGGAGGGERECKAKGSRPAEMGEDCWGGEEEVNCDYNILGCGEEMNCVCRREFGGGGEGMCQLPAHVYGGWGRAERMPLL